MYWYIYPYQCLFHFPSCWFKISVAWYLLASEYFPRYFGKILHSPIIYKMLGSHPSLSPISFWSEGLLISPHFWSVTCGCSVIGWAPSISVTWPARSSVIGQMLRLDCSDISGFIGVLPRPVFSAISGPGGEVLSSVVPDKWRDTVLLLSLFQIVLASVQLWGRTQSPQSSWLFHIYFKQTSTITRRN